jgi:predicted DNA-binding transcriptional regulator AlpA
VNLALDRIPAYLARSGKSHSAFYRAVNDGTHTPPVKIGARSAAIPRHEADAILAAEINGATPEQLKKLVVVLMEQRKTFMPVSMREASAA